MTQSKSHLRLRALCEGAVFIALAQVLSYLKLFELPQGGSITIEMLPIFLYCARWGFGPGMLASFAYSILQAVLSSTYAWTWQSLIGDYLLAFTVLGFAGACSKLKGGFFIGTVVGSVARFLVHYVVGATIWAEYMPETFFGLTMTSPWFYSALYNGSFMLIDMVLVLIVGALLICIRRQSSGAGYFLPTTAARAAVEYDRKEKTPCSVPISLRSFSARKSTASAREWRPPTAARCCPAAERRAESISATELLRVSRQTP